MQAMESVRSECMRQRFRFEFIGEPGVDAGGVAREWFHLVSEGSVRISCIPIHRAFVTVAINTSCFFCRVFFSRMKPFFHHRRRF